MTTLMTIPKTQYPSMEDARLKMPAWRSKPARIRRRLPSCTADGKCLAYISNNQVFLMNLTSVFSNATAASPLLLADLPTGRDIPNFKQDKLQWRPGRFSKRNSLMCIISFQSLCRALPNYTGGGQRLWKLRSMVSSYV